MWKVKGTGSPGSGNKIRISSPIHDILDELPGGISPGGNLPLKK